MSETPPDLREAVSELFWTLVEAARIPQMVEWLARRLP